MEPWPNPFELKPCHRLFIEKHGKNVLWVNEQLRLCQEWNTKKAIRRSEIGWTQHFTNWLKQAILFESEKAAGQAAYSNNAHCVPRQPILPPLDGREIFEHSRKYKELRGEEAAQYLAKLPERIRKLVK